MDVHDEDGDGIELEASTIHQDLSVPVRENKASLPSTLAALKAVSFSLFVSLSFDADENCKK